MARTGLSQSQEPGIQSWSPVWVAGTQLSHHQCFPGFVLAGGQSQSQALSVPTAKLNGRPQPHTLSHSI